VVSDKRPALMVSDRPDGDFEQVSPLADTPDTDEHAAAVTVHDGRLWVFYSVKEDVESGGNHVRLKHAPIDDIPADPGGWADEGPVVENARDPGLFRVGDRWYMFFSSEGWREEGGGERVGEYDNVGRVESEDLLHWEGHTDPVYHEAHDQAPDVVPKADGSGYWLVVTEYAPGKDAYAVAGESEAVDGQFSGRVALCDPGRIGDTSEPWFGSMTTHFDYCKRDACGALYEHGGRIPAYFEARGDGPYSVGVAFAPGPNPTSKKGTRPTGRYERTQAPPGGDAGVGTGAHPDRVGGRRPGGPPLRRRGAGSPDGGRPRPGRTHREPGDDRRVRPGA